MYAPESAAVPAARELVRAALGAWSVASGRVEDAVLIASELMTNAVVHAGTEIELACELAEPEGRIRVEVRDLLPLRRITEPDIDRAPESVEARHRGLVLTHSLTDVWGVSYTKTTKTVWFELGAGDADAVVEDAAGTPVAEPAEMPAGDLLPRPVGLPDERMIDHVVQWMRATTGADAAYVLVSGDGGLQVRATAQSGDAPELKPDSGADGLTEPVPAELVADRLELAEEAAHRAAGGPDHGGVLPAPPGSRFQSLACIPMQVDGNRLGLVVVGAEQPGRFVDAHLVRLRYAASALAPVLSRERQSVTRQDYHGWLGFLAEASDLLAGTLDEKLVLALAAQLFVPRIASWCAFYQEEPGGTSRLSHVWHADEQRITALRATLEKAAPPVPRRLRDPRAWTGFELLGTADRETCGPRVLELPLTCRDHRFGAVLLGGPEGGEFRSELVRLAEDLGDRVAMTLLTARRYGEQASTSQILQRSLLPSRLPQIPGLDYNIVYIPAGEGTEAGGDFYDIFAAGPGRWRFMLGDVCGTGPEAAAVTGLARHTLRALSREGHSAARALDRLNETMLDDNAARLLTMVHGELEPVPAGMRLSVAAAGHPLPLLLRPSGEVTALGESQLLLGAVPGGYHLDTMQLEPGDLVLCVTDGITERRHGDRLLDDDDGLARILAECAGLTARAVTLRVHGAVRDFSDTPLDDDMAIMALHVE